MHMYSMTETQLQTQLNSAFEIAIYSLEATGVITQEQKEEILGHYALVVSCKGWLGSIFDKLVGRDGNDYFISLVKMIATEGKKNE